MKRKILFLFCFVFVKYSFSQQTIKYKIIARSNSGDHFLFDGKKISIFGFAQTLMAPPTMPGPILTCTEGDSVILDTWSVSQGEHHTIHLHGLDVDTRNDGDPATSFWLEHMQDTTYSFRAKNAGTYIYHCHVGDVVHVQMGMYGLIIVRPKNPKTAWNGGPSFTKEYAWLMSEVDSKWHDSIPIHDPLTDKIQLPPYVPDYFLVNGKSRQQLADTNISVYALPGDTVYVRLSNIGFLNNRVIFPTSLNARVIDSDGRPLPTSIKSDTVEVWPGERYGVLISSASLLVDSIKVEYINMNTNKISGIEKVPVKFGSGAGIPNLIEEETKVYPNPVTSYLFIEGGGPIENFKFEIYNSTGKLVKNGIIGRKSYIDLEFLPPGVYFLRINNDQSLKFEGKFLKVKD